MIVCETYKVKLMRTFNKILYLSLSINDTFVFVGVVGVGRDGLYHCNKQGKILYEYMFDYPVDSFAMMNMYQVLILYPKSNKIYIFNLIQKRYETYPHQFMHEESDQSEIIAFEQTTLVCVKQKGKYNDHRLVLTYYKHPLWIKSKQYAKYQSSQNEWTTQMPVFKGNNHSLFIWCKRAHGQEINIRTFDLKDSFKQYKLRNTLGGYDLNKIEISVNYAFQLRPNELLLACFANKNQSRTLNKDGIINNNFILNTQIPQSPFVCESKIYFQSPYNDLIIDVLNIGAYSIFRTCNYRNGQVQSSPIYYIDNKTDKIVLKQYWKCTYLTKYFIPGYSDDQIMQCDFQNGYVDHFIMRHKVIKQQ